MADKLKERKSSFETFEETVKRMLGMPHQTHAQKEREKEKDSKK